MGAVLGDGTISARQVRLFLSSVDDRAYALWVRELSRALFGVTAGVAQSRWDNTLCVALSSTNVVDFLDAHGLGRGDKVARQVDMPSWIRSSPSLARACVRGLMDTDGSVYTHDHTVRGHRYRHLGLRFSSHSVPPLRAVHGVLCEADVPARTDGRRHVSVYRGWGVARYFEIIGTSNPKHWRKYRSWTRRGDRAAEGAALEMPCTGNPCAAGSNPAPSANH